MTGRIKKFIARDEQGRLFMKVVDKIPTAKILNLKSKKLCCPPHRLPHTLTGKKVEDEPCHAHATDWRYYTHHLPYCLLTSCPYAEEMRKARKLYLKRLKTK